MEYAILGSSNIKVSRVCLGSMTWGVQNNQQQANEQIDYAFEQGVNFIDAAEMYPVPPSAQTYGDTERVIGEYLSLYPDKREQLIIASKIAGSGFSYIREGSPISGDTISIALDASLKRLKTDYIDLYQLHWPNRFSPHFGKHWPNQVKATKQDAKFEKDTMRSILLALDAAIKSGKIRHWGLSDDTPWGIHTYLDLCRELDVPEPVSIQNEFSLLHAKDWPYLIETCVFEDIAYLPWSPLAGGLLTGKYIDGARPGGTRFTMSQRQGLFRDTDLCNQAVKAYVELANQIGISPAQLALCWCNQVDGVTSTIIGATSLPQLKQNIEAFNVVMSDKDLSEIDRIFKQYPIPF